MLTDEVLSSVMLGAGLLAKKAVEMGLKVAPYIKTSLRCDFFLKTANFISELQPWQWCGDLLSGGKWRHSLP